MCNSLHTTCRRLYWSFGKKTDHNYMIKSKYSKDYNSVGTYKRCFVRNDIDQKYEAPNLNEVTNFNSTWIVK